MRLQSVVHANRRLKEVPYGDHAVSLEERVRYLCSPPVQLSSRVHGRVCGVKGWVSRCDPKGHKERRRHLDFKGATPSKSPKYRVLCWSLSQGLIQRKAAPKRGDEPKGIELRAPGLPEIPAIFL